MLAVVLAAVWGGVELVTGPPVDAPDEPPPVVVVPLVPHPARLRTKTAAVAADNPRPHRPEEVCRPESNLLINFPSDRRRDHPGFDDPTRRDHRTSFSVLFNSTGILFYIMRYDGAVGNPSEPLTKWASRQRRAGERMRRETQGIVLRAASDEFAEQGYAGATIRKIADRAEVSVQSVYSAWGSKRALLRGVLESALTGNPEAELDERAVDRVWGAGLAVGADPEVVLRFIARQFCQIARQAATGWLTYLDAIGTDPMIAADWQQLMSVRRDSFSIHIGRIADVDFRPGLNRQSAIDTAWVIVSPQSYDLLVRRAGYDEGRFEQWIGDTLCAALLDPTRRSGHDRHVGVAFSRTVHWQSVTAGAEKNLERS